MNTGIQAGFNYLVEVIDADGNVKDSEVVHNLMPLEGINHTMSVTLKGATQVGAWYVGIFEGNYTPTSGDAAATLPAAATECTAYDEATRQALTLGTVTGGAADNSASRAVFTMNATKTVYGGFIVSAAAKGAVSGTLLSVVRFLSPKTLSATDLLRVTAGFTLASL